MRETDVCVPDRIRQHLMELNPKKHAPNERWVGDELQADSHSAYSASNFHDDWNFEGCDLRSHSEVRHEMCI